MNQEVAKARGVEVINTPGRNARSVAEFTVAMILAEMRNIARSHDALRDKYWRKESPNHQAIPELGGKVVGLVGLGHIARLVAGFLSGFGTEIIFTISTCQAMNAMKKSTLWMNLYNVPTLYRCTLA